MLDPFGVFACRTKAYALQRPVDAAAREKDDEQQQWTEHDLPVLARFGSSCRIEGRNRRADDRRQKLLEKKQRRAALFRSPDTAVHRDSLRGTLRGSGASGLQSM